jgi:hypothetical protein
MVKKNFRISDDYIVVFNDDKIAWEDFSNDDFSSAPLCLLSFSAEKLDRWIEAEIDLQLKAQEREKMREKEKIKAQIERLQKQLENL